MTASLARAIHALRRSPGYAATSVASVALGLALATATFAFADAILNPPVPFDAPDRLFVAELRLGNQRTPPTVGEQARLLRALPSIEAVAVTTGDQPPVLLSQDNRYAITTAMSPDLWRVMGVQLPMGRLPTTEEAREGRAAVVSDRVWHSEFEGRATIGNATLTVGDHPYTVVGVLPRRANTVLYGDVWIPFSAPAVLDTLAASFYMRTATLVVRLRPGETPATAAPDLERYARDLSRLYVSGGAPPYRVTLRPIRGPGRQASEFELLLYGMAFGILAIGCTNVSALTLARGITRRRDYAIRRALGASRSAIGREVLAEVLAIVLAGAGAGFALTYGIVGLFTRIVPIELIWAGFEPPTMNARVFAFVGLAVLISTGLAGGFPAWRAASVDPSDPLKDGAGTTTGRSRTYFRALVFGELAVAMVLLMMASLVSLSARNRAAYDFGFAADRVVSAFVAPPRPVTGATPLPDGSAMPRFAPRTTAAADARPLRDHLMGVIRSVPGVTAVATASGGGVPGGQIVSDRSASGEPVLRTRTLYGGTAGFFGTLGVPVIEGRDFEPADAAGQRVAVLSARAAGILFPRGDAVGRRIKAGGLDTPGDWVPVVGVVRDFQEFMTPDPDVADPGVFFSDNDRSAGWHFVARVERSDPMVIAEIRNRLTDAMPPGSRVGVQRYLANYDPVFRMGTFLATLFGALGFASLALGAVGLFSVLSYVVGQRNREFAVRTSLGATPINLLAVVVRSALEYALGGTAIGALVSFWASAGVSGFLFGVKNTDPVSLVTAELVLVSVTMLASLGPALRAARVNPLEIIRAA